MSSHTIYITRNCNMNCAYCYERSKAKDNMNKSDALKILQHVYSITDSPVYIEIIGGEPLLNWPVFLDICEYNTSCAKHISTITNGTLLSNHIITSLIDHNVLVGISYDGKSSHDVYRKKYNLSGTEQLVRKNIITSLNMGLNIVINIAFHNANAHTICDDVLDLVYLGIDKFKIHTVNNNKFKASDYAKKTAYEKLSNIAINNNILFDMKLNLAVSTQEHYYYYKDIIKCVKSGMLGKWESVSWDN